MTDEEKAEEYAEDYKTKDGRSLDYCDIEKAYLDGLAEGRKELEKELGWITDTDNYIDTKLTRCIELEKENAELSNSILEFSNSVIELTNTETELENKVTELEKQIEKMKCCENCKHSYTDSENVGFCYLPFPQENCKSCKLYNHKNTDNDYWELAE